MSRSLINVALAILAGMALSACGEKPPRPDPEGTPAYSNETPQNPRYERTLEQGETERMSG